MITFPLHRAQSEFTLIELLTVIAIIGILAAIVIPTVGSVREKAQRAVDANNLREIAKAAMIYASDNKDRLPNPDTIASSGGLSDANKVFLWPGILARTKALNDASFYFSKIDPSFDGEVPAAIISPNNNKALDSSFTSGRELSLEFVGGLKMSDPPQALRSRLPEDSGPMARGIPTMASMAILAGMSFFSVATSNSTPIPRPISSSTSARGNAPTISCSPSPIAMV